MGTCIYFGSTARQSYEGQWEPCGMCRSATCEGAGFPTTVRLLDFSGLVAEMGQFSVVLTVSLLIIDE